MRFNIIVPALALLILIMAVIVVGKEIEMIHILLFGIGFAYFGRSLYNNIRKNKQY